MDQSEKEQKYSNENICDIHIYPLVQLNNSENKYVLDNKI